MDLGGLTVGVASVLGLPRAGEGVDGVRLVTEITSARTVRLNASSSVEERQTEGLPTAEALGVFLLR
jgi:hypothetical protein